MSRPLTCPAQRAPAEFLRPVEIPAAGDFRPPEFTDEALALRFAEAPTPKPAPTERPAGLPRWPFAYLSSTSERGAIAAEGVT
jgi:hypothetical protein